MVGHLDKTEKNALWDTCFFFFLGLFGGLLGLFWGFSETAKRCVSVLWSKWHLPFVNWTNGLAMRSILLKALFQKKCSCRHPFFCIFLHFGGSFRGLWGSLRGPKDASWSPLQNGTSHSSIGLMVWPWDWFCWRHFSKKNSFLKI